MRVIAGKARSLPLKTPVGMDTRPTTDRIKDTLFNILSPDIPDAVFMDLFSGSGGIGIEALSRGAKRAYFVEQNNAAASCISDNLKFTRLMDQAVLLKQDVYSALYGISEKEADIIFADPPYHEGHEERLLQTLSELHFVTENTLIIIEADLKTELSFAEEFGFDIIREKKYKTNKHIFLRKVIE